MKMFRLALLCSVAFSGVAFAGPRHGIATDIPTFAPSQRTTLNMNLLDTLDSEYQYIDHVQGGGGAGGIAPVDLGTYASPGYWVSSGSGTWNTNAGGANLDTKGWPQNFTLVQAHIGANGFGSHVYFPASSNYGADPVHPYVFKWSGDCQLKINSAITGSGTVTWSNVTQTAGSNFVNNSNGNWQGTDVRLTVNLTNGGLQEVGWRILSTGQYTGNYCHDLHIYRLDDETDFLAGLIFRAPWKQLIVAQAPSAVRTMDWHGGFAYAYRWENRAPYPYATYGGAYHTISPAYGDMTLCAAAANQFCVSGVSGTPASMTHGEVAEVRLTVSMANGASGGYAISTVNKCTTGVAPCNTTGQVVTSGNHPFLVGDKVIFTTSAASGMTQINFYNTTVTAVQDSTHFSTSLDTTGFSSPGGTLVISSGTYNSGTGVVSIVASTTPNVATGDTISVTLTGTGAVSSLNGSKSVASVSGSTITYTVATGLTATITGGNITAINGASSSGNVAPFVTANVGNRGDWPIIDPTAEFPLGSNGGVNFFHANDVRTLVFDKTIYSSRDGSGNPVLGAWITEIIQNGSPFIRPMQMQAPVELSAILIKELNLLSAKPIDLYLNLPATALLSMDPDYSAGSNYTTNPVNAVKAIIPTRQIFLEPLGNEVWHQPSQTFPSASYYRMRALARAGQPPGPTGEAYMYGLRFTAATQDLGVSANVHPVIGLQGAIGIDINNGQPNYGKVFGGALYYADAVVQALPTVSKTGDTHTNTTIDNIASTSGLYKGWGVACSTVCQAGTQIISVATNSIVISPATTGTAAGKALTLTPPPISYAWGSTYASYFDPPSAYMSTVTGTGTFTDDSAMFNGTDNSGNGGGNYTGAANTTQAVANFVAQIVGTSAGACTTAPTPQTIGTYTLLNGCFTASFGPIGKATIQYEGGQDWATGINFTQSGHVITSADQAFILAVNASSQWSTAFQNWLASFRSGTLAYMPAKYVMVDPRFGDVPVNASGLTAANQGTFLIDDYLAAVEGGALSIPWTANGTANQGITP